LLDKEGKREIELGMKRGAKMIKNKDEIIKDNANKISDIVKTHVDELDVLSETSQFTIDNIEKMWDKLDKNAREIYREIGQEVIAQIDEKRIIKSKKANTGKKE